MFGPGRARLAAAYARVYVLHIVIFMRVMLRPAASFRPTVVAVIQLPHSECVRVYWRAIWLRVRSGERVIYIFVVVLILSVHYLFFCVWRRTDGVQCVVSRFAIEARLARRPNRVCPRSTTAFDDVIVANIAHRRGRRALIR